MLLKGLMVTALSGKLDGLIASHNRGGPYFKQFVIPVDPATANQGYCRSAMSDLAALWASMSGEQRQSWENYARTLTVTNRIGDRRTITGRAAFFRERLPHAQKNYALDAADTNVDPDAPLAPYPAFGTLPTVAVTGAHQLTLTWPYPMGWENTAADIGMTGFIIHVGRGVSTLVNWYKGPYIPAYWLESDEDTPPTSPKNLDTSTSTPTVVPNFVTGKRYFWRLRLFWEQHVNTPVLSGFSDASF